MKRGLILGGVVGCGKTTLIREFLKNQSYKTIELTCDDTKFRAMVADDSKTLLNIIKQQTQEPVFLFIDEVQKSEEVFDAIKYAYDHHPMHFIVSGSNPDYLNSIAKKRLQRRADFITLNPFSLSEILIHKKYMDEEVPRAFKKMLYHNTPAELPLKISHSEFIADTCLEYLTFGGIPRAFLSSSTENKLLEIKQVIERGFESFSTNNNSLRDQIIMEMGNLHAQEFTYQGIFKRTGTTKRDTLNIILDELQNHGYLIKKKPKIINENRTSYLSHYSWTDPGIVTYLTGIKAQDEVIGGRVEGLVFTRLMHYKNIFPTKADLSYYKPFSIDEDYKLKFLKGEIDFLFSFGKEIIPIEVKAGIEFQNFKLDVLEKFITKYRSKFGIVLYAGAPFFDVKKRIQYWPYWGI